MWTTLLVLSLPFCLDSYFTNVLPEGVNGMVVVHNTCGDHYTYQLDGPDAIFSEKVTSTTRATTTWLMRICPFMQHNFSDTREHCEYDLRIFPSRMEDSHVQQACPLHNCGCTCLSSSPQWYLFSTTVSAQRRDGDGEAHQRYCFVAIPSNVRDRILKDAEEQAEQDMLNNKKGFGAAPKNRLKTFLDEDKGAQAFDTKPIADLFPHTTVMFGILLASPLELLREPRRCSPSSKRPAV
jgi:hypothetical protein